MKFSTTSGDTGIVTVTLLSDGLVMIADRNHPRFDVIAGKIIDLRGRGYTYLVPEDEQEEVRRLFDMRTAVEEAFGLTKRVTLRGNLLYFDGEPVENVLADHVLRAIRQGLDKSAYMPFIRFWERVQSNPSKHSKENLMRWLMAEEFTISDDGFIVGYKGVKDDLTSCTAGPGFVNGAYAHGNLDNSPGNVVEVARSYVTEDPGRHCAQGLHVGTWKYASNFGPKTLEVWVDPSDVVSVPTDCNGEKMRVSKYTVKKILNEGYSLAVLDTEVAPIAYEDIEDGVEECLECGSTDCEGYCDDYCDECEYPLDECDCDEDDR